MGGAAGVEGAGWDGRGRDRVGGGGWCFGHGSQVA